MEFIRKDELREMLHNSIEYWKDKDDCTLKAEESESEDE